MKEQEEEKKQDERHVLVSSSLSLSKHDDDYYRMRSTEFDSLSVKDKALQLYYNKELLAPMVRASTTPLRTLALKYGADTVYSEEMVDRSILKSFRVINKNLKTIDYIRDKTDMSPKQLRKLRINSNNPSLEYDNLNLPVILRIDPLVERDRFVLQLGTGEPDLALKAAKMVQNDVCGIDINMGCPKKFSVSGGMGAALLGDKNRACQIIQTLRTSIPNIPISAKIRLLKTQESTIEFVKGLQDAGVSAIAIHARYAGEEPSATLAQWDQLSDLIPHIKVPLIINGDLYTRDDIFQVKNQCGNHNCSIMLARPALFNTSIFSTRQQQHFASNKRQRDEEETTTSPLTKKAKASNDDENKSSTAANSDNSKSPANNTITTDGAVATAITVDQTKPNNHNEEETATTTTTTISWTKRKHKVIQEYLYEAVRYETNYQNVKYVVCEMLSQRRTPIPLMSKLNYNLDSPYHINHTIGTICQQKTIEELCTLWNVNPTKLLNQHDDDTTTTATTTTVNKQRKDQTNDSTNAVNSHQVLAPSSATTTTTTTEQKYDDRYFLDPDGLRRDMDAAEKSKQTTDATKN